MIELRRSKYTCHRTGQAIRA